MLESFHTWLIQAWPRLLGALAIFAIGWFAAKGLIHLIIAAMRRAGVEPTLVSFLGSFFTLAGIAVVIVAALTFLGVPSASMLAVLGAAGLAVALSLQNSLSNFASGLILSIFRPFKVGDTVDINGDLGIVESIEIFYTRFRTPDNRGMVLPNSVIASSKLLNLTAKDTRRIDLEVGVSYQENLDHVLSTLRSILANDPRILPDPPPLVGVARFADSSINIWIRPWVKRADFFDVMLDLNRQIKQRFDAEGITIPFPQREIRVVSSDSSTPSNPHPSTQPAPQR